MAGQKRSYSQAPPTNYVAGLGRGATGFTTRSDIGPARSVISQAVPDKDETGRMAPKEDLPQFMQQAAQPVRAARPLSCICMQYGWPPN
jgi:hypothetical protein